MALISFSGIASGIDSASLIEALLDQQRQARITPLETAVTELQETNSSLEELSTLLDNLKSSVDIFRVINGGGVAKTGLSSDESILSAAASNSAQTGTYDITVNQLAKNATFSFDDRFSSGDTAINSSINDGAADADRTVSFTVGTGGDAENIDIVLTSTTSANDFVQQFNAQSDKATASLINVGTTASPSYAIMINSDSEGTEDGTITLNSVGTEVQTAGAGAGAFTSNQLNQATDLEFTLDGVAGTITRSSNTVSDVVSGVTFTASDVGSATISVGVDSETTRGSLEEFVEAYNEIVAFIAENDTVTRDESGAEVTNIFGPLAGTSLDENIISALRSAFSESSSSGNLAVNTLADLGITTDRDGSLLFDGDVFTEAIGDDPAGTESLLARLGENLGAVDGTIAQFTRFNGLIDQSVFSNTEQISAKQTRISDVEDSLARQEQALTAQFARLEAQIGQLQSQQNALLSLLPQ